MKHQISTIQENGKYVGLVLKNGELIFKTEPRDTPNEASALMTAFIQKNGNNPNSSSVKIYDRPTLIHTSKVQATVSSPIPINPSPTVASSTTPIPRKCCGRG